MNGKYKTRIVKIALRIGNRAKRVNCYHCPLKHSYQYGTWSCGALPPYFNGGRYADIDTHLKHHTRHEDCPLILEEA